MLVNFLFKTFGYAEFVRFGYKRGDGGKLAIDKPDAVIVRKIFRMRAEGHTLGEILNWLYKNGISSPTGKAHWSHETISKLLRNENMLGMFCFRRLLFKIYFRVSKSRTTVSWKGF